jgi:arylamine N-acetyltransferase
LDSDEGVASTRSAEETGVSQTWVERYLALLGAGRREPSLESLTELIRAHKFTVPFTNVSAVARKAASAQEVVPPLDCDALLSGWEERRCGGVCFELAEMFSRLLGALGYRATRLYGSVRNACDHQAVIVDFGGRRYLADVGSGMPVLAPVPLEGEVRLLRGGAEMRWRPGEQASEWLQERLTDGEWQTVFRYDLAGPTADQVWESYQRHHTPGYNFVMTNMVVVRCTEDALFQLRGDTFTHSTAEATTVSPVPDAAEACRLVRDVIGLPGLPIERTLALLASLQPPA